METTDNEKSMPTPQTDTCGGIGHYGVSDKYYNADSHNL